MGLDIRIPIGAMFAILGLLLGVYGLMTSGDMELYQKSLFLNINLWWGVVLLVFGLIMLGFGRKAARVAGARPATESAEGRATEEREHRLGLEREYN
jgi:hypothetical protein